MKAFWQLYYKFKKCNTKSSIVVRHCRLNGVRYYKLKLNQVTAYELLGKRK